MKFLSFNNNLFSMVYRERGYQYFKNKRVQISYANDSYLMAQVRGADTHKVEVAWLDGFLYVCCACPAAQSKYCEHIYAVLLSIPHSKYLLSCFSFANIPLKLVLPGDIGKDDAGVIRIFSRQKEIGKPEEPPLWDVVLNAVQGAINCAANARTMSVHLDHPREIIYIIRPAINHTASALTRDLTINIATRSRKKNGDWGNIKNLNITDIDMSQGSEEDAKILSILSGAKTNYNNYHLYYGNSNLLLTQPMANVVLPAISAVGRLFYQNERAETLVGPLFWQEEQIWTPVLKLVADLEKGGYSFFAELRSQESAIDLSEPEFISNQNIMLLGDKISRIDALGVFPWLEQLQKQGRLEISNEHVHDFIKKLYCMPLLPPVELPEDLRVCEVAGDVKICLTLRTRQSYYYMQDKKKFLASLEFSYSGCQIPAFPQARGFYSPERGCYLLRDGKTEEEAILLLRELGFKSIRDADNQAIYEISSDLFSKVVFALTARNWLIEADGKLYREARCFNISVTTGIDWFELHGECEFENQKAKLPQLLSALRKKEGLIELSDGTFGVIPEEMLKKYAFLARMGDVREEHVRFKKSQAGLLDALLASQPEATCDALFENTRQQLQNFQGIRPSAASASFQGELRRYQEEGLGWFEFLRKFGYGGCLADDMGLGKTVQALALLEKQRQLRLYETSRMVGNLEKEGQNGGRPSLVVAPRSIVFNWLKEAAKFTPGLKTLDYTGLARKAGGCQFENYDLVATTYGTLRRDIEIFRRSKFDYVILDEAQCIKNAETISAKAVRLLRANHRLALSGTPIENHLSELWSLFEFLNPGLLGAATVFKQMSADTNAASSETRELLSRALKPFILRRAKAHVAPELPQKTEQVVYCEMEKTQARLYNELRDHYRQSLLKRLDEEGIGKSKIHILEALLRLRQAACHPALLDPKWQNSASAKTEFLFPQLSEILEEGHKALIFSQFTSFLAIIKKQLDKSGHNYLYLDGKTKNREQLVRVFQEENSANLFLISLRAGGLGLNLTAAEYVYLLDPWWNPAVEAQAIDRTHRIGQTEQVFAYRLITRNTVEERVLELQQSKKDLFAALIQEDTGLLRSLNREDLEILLS